MNRSFVRVSVLAWGLFFSLSSAHAASISVNFAIGATATDDYIVDPDESSTVGNPDAVTIPGNRWNNVLIGGNGGGGTLFRTNTTGGNFISLSDDAGNSNVARITSTLTANTFVGFNSISSTNNSATGDAGLLNSYFGISSTDGVITFSNLGSAYTNYGYKVVAFFDIGGVNRNYGIRVDDGSTAATYFTNDTAAADSDANDDGVISWVRTTATTTGTAVTDANYAVFDGLTGSSFTLTGIVGGSGRSAISGIQIIANPVPEPSTYALVVLGCVVLWRGRGKGQAAL